MNLQKIILSLCCARIHTHDYILQVFFRAASLLYGGPVNTVIIICSRGGSGDLDAFECEFTWLICYGNFRVRSNIA